MQQAVSATVSGNDQEVGFRALVMKQAIEYNLAGSAKNDKDEIVQFTLQGELDADRCGADDDSQGNQEIVRYQSQHSSDHGRRGSEDVHGRRLDVDQSKHH